jgi:hypothetical protein
VQQQQLTGSAFQQKLVGLHLAWEKYTNFIVSTRARAERSGDKVLRAFTTEELPDSSAE